MVFAFVYSILFSFIALPIGLLVLIIGTVLALVGTGDGINPDGDI